MKRLYFFLLFFIATTTFANNVEGTDSMFKHPYFVSITQVDFNPQTKSIEISMKIFTNDLEKGIEKKSGKKIELHTAKDADNYIAQYIQSHFSVMVNQQKTNIKYVGKEKEDDATWCYLEISNISNISHISITNSILTEIFDSQNNIVHIKVGKSQKSMLLSRRKTSDEISF